MHVFTELKHKRTKTVDGKIKTYAKARMTTLTQFQKIRRQYILINFNIYML